MFTIRGFEEVECEGADMGRVTISGCIRGFWVGVMLMLSGSP